MGVLGHFFRDNETGEVTPLRWPIGCAMVIVIGAAKLFLYDAWRRDEIPWPVIPAGIVVLLGIAFVVDRRERNRRAPIRELPTFGEGDVGKPYLVEVQGAAGGPRRRFRLTVAPEGLRLDGTGKSAVESSAVAAAELWSVTVAHHRFELRRAEDAAPEVITLGADDSDRLAWELALRFPAAMERGLASADASASDGAAAS